MPRNGTVTKGLLVIGALLAGAGGLQAGIVLTTENIPNGGPPGSSLGTTFGRPLAATFDSIPNFATVPLSGGPPTFSGGTLFGDTGGAQFLIGRPGGGIAAQFPIFAQELTNPYTGAPLNPGLTLVLDNTLATSFVSVGGAFEGFGFRISDFGSPTDTNLLIINVYEDYAGTGLLASFTVNTGFIQQNGVAFIGIGNDGIGGTFGFTRVDLLVGGTLQSDSTQFDAVRAVLIPEPGMAALFLGGLASLGLVRRLRRRS